MSCCRINIEKKIRIKFQQRKCVCIYYVYKVENCANNFRKIFDVCWKKKFFFPASFHFVNTYTYITLVVVEVLLTQVYKKIHLLL